VKNGAAVSFSGKAQRKPLELLKALIALGGREVSNARLLDLLWPDSQGDAGVKAIEAALHRLRKLLECDQAVRSREGKLTLDPHYCWVDVWALERLLNRFEALERQPRNEFELEEVALSVFRLYQGHFLAQEDEAPWMLGLRERLRGRFVRHVLALGRRREQTERWSSAAELYERALELDNLNEELYRRLMLCQKTLGHYAEALEVYRRCRRMLSACWA
jgi:two-component SAPR family response regulator